MKFQNQNSGEVQNVTNLRIKNDCIFFTVRGKGAGDRFFRRNTSLVRMRDADGGTYCKVADGWKMVGEVREKTPKKAAEKPEAVEVKNIPTATENAPKTTENAPEVQPTKTANKPTATDEDDAVQLARLLARMKGGNIDGDEVRKIVIEEFARLAASKPDAAKVVPLAAKKEQGDGSEVYCKDFCRIVAKVSRGNNVYLHGRAGSGKSHTAEQVAEALGLKFYGQTTIQFAHDVRGYGDAGGNFVDTPFYKAFSGGGLYFQDEYDRSNAEAAIVLNTALANRYYDFPVVGRVEMHPEFRFMAAGNTLMKGADEEYITGQIIDASSRDRFGFFFAVDYSHDVEMKIAHGNAEIVAFVEDMRQAIDAANVRHVVSYRATAAMADEVENENDLAACVRECVCKGLEIDEVRLIYHALNNKSNQWAKAMAKMF